MSGCGEYIRLTENEKKWNPYLPNEILVFKSHDMEIDTIFIKEIIDGRFHQGQAPRKYYDERLGVYALHSDNIYKNYLYANPLLDISAGTPEKESEIEFNIISSGFYFNNNRFSINELEKLETITIKTPFGVISDVIQLNDISNYKYPENKIRKIYWSKNLGVIRFEKNDSIFWELINKYVP